MFRKKYEVGGKTLEMIYPDEGTYLKEQADIKAYTESPKYKARELKMWFGEDSDIYKNYVKGIDPYEETGD